MKTSVESLEALLGIPAPKWKNTHKESGSRRWVFRYHGYRSVVAQHGLKNWIWTVSKIATDGTKEILATANLREPSKTSLLARGAAEAFIKELLARGTISK